MGSGQISALSPTRRYMSAGYSGTGTWLDANGANGLVATGAPSKTGKAVVLDGVSYFTSPEAASVWNYLHNGAGGTAVLISKKTTAAAVGIAFDTMNPAGNLPGLQFYYNTGAAYGAYSGQAAGAAVVNASVAGGFSIGNRTCAILSYLEGASPEWRFSINGMLITGNSTNAPTANDAGSTLIVGARANGTNGFIGEIYELLFFSRVLAPSEELLVNQYAASNY